MTITINDLGSSNTGSKTLGSSIAAGALIVVMVWDEGLGSGSHNTVTDNAAVPNTYTFLAASAIPSVGAAPGGFGNFGGLAIYYCLNANAVASGKVISIAGGANVGMSVWSATTTAGTWTLDTAATAIKGNNNVQVTSVSLTSGVPTNAGEAFFSLLGAKGSGSTSLSVTAGNGWTAQAQSTGGTGINALGVSQIRAAGTAATCAFTSSASQDLAITVAAFVASAASVTASPVVTTLKSPTQTFTAAEVEPDHIISTLKSPTQSGTIQVNNPKANITTKLPLWTPRPTSEWSLLNHGIAADDQFGGSSGHISFTGNIPAGSLVVIMGIGEGGTLIGSGSVTDTQGNTYVGGGSTYSVAPGGNIANGVLHAFWGITQFPLTAADTYFIGYGPPGLYIYSAWSGADIGLGGSGVVDCIGLNQSIGTDIASGTPAAPGDLFVGMTYAIHCPVTVSTMTIPSGWTQTDLGAVTDVVDNVEGKCGIGMSYFINGQLNAAGQTFNSTFNNSPTNGATLVISFRRAKPIETFVGNINNSSFTTTANPVVTTLKAPAQSLTVIEQEKDTILTTLKPMTQLFSANTPPDGNIITTLKSLSQVLNGVEKEPSTIITTLFAIKQSKVDALVEPLSITTTLLALRDTFQAIEREPNTIITTLKPMTQVLSSSVSPGGAIITNLKSLSQVFDTVERESDTIVTTLPSITQLFNTKSLPSAAIVTTLFSLSQRLGATELEPTHIGMTLHGFAQRNSVTISVPFTLPSPGQFYSYWG